MGLLLAACGPAEPPPDLNNDGGTARDGGGGGGDVWAVTLVDPGGQGHAISAASSAAGAVGAAWWAVQGRTDGPCDELGVQTPPDRVRWQLRYGTFDGAAWTVETVAEPLMVGAPRGLSFRFAPDGTPLLAAHAGEPVVPLRYCGANDAGLYRRTGPGTWTVETAAASSGQAATGEPASDYGEVVGDWPSLAFDAAGNPALAYKDVHAGGMQSDDFGRADLELAWRSGATWRHLPVDFGEGAGSWSSLVFDAENRPVILYYVPSDGLVAARHGLWVARSDDQGATWLRARVHAGASAARPSLTLHRDTGALVAAWYDASEGVPKRARYDGESTFDQAASWPTERIGDPRFDEGYHPSVAVDPSGHVAVAYYRCVDAGAGLGACDPNDDAVILAWEDAGTWTREIVDSGDEGLCGTTPSLTFDAEGRAVVVYGCSERVGDGFELRVKAAVREPLK